MNYLSAQVLEREMNYLSVKCWVYVCGGLFGSAVDKKNEKKDYLSVSVGCTLVYVCGTGSFGSAVSKQAKRASSFEDVCKWPYIL